MQKVSPFLWYSVPAKNAKEVVDYYKAIFKEDCILTDESTFDETPSGPVVVCNLTIGGQPMRFMCTRDERQFTEAISFELMYEDQAEINYYWNALTAEGKESMCGWCTDKYGLSWQIQPKNMGELTKNPAAFQAMLGMRKIIIADLETANQ